MVRMTTGRWASLGVALLALTACNMVSGADDVTFSDDDDDSGGEMALSGGSGTGGSASVSSVVGAGTGGATSGANSTVASAVSSSASGSNNCDYPEGPYGVSAGQVVPPSISWQGYLPGGTSATTIALSDYFDCDGSKGINAILIDTSQYG